MARNYTRAQLRTRARYHADLDGTDVGVLDARVNELIDYWITDVYREIVKAGPPDQYATDSNIVTVSGTTAYALPADFWILTNLLAQTSTDGRRPMHEINGSQRVYYRAPQAVYTVTMEYIAAPPTLGLDGTTFDGIAGFEELVTKGVARDMLTREQSDAMGLTGEVARLLGEVRSSGRRTRQAREITDIYASEDDGWWGTNMLTAYRLRGNNVELYERRVWIP